jgi:mono/diheme cytochrome c family protein
MFSLKFHLQKTMDTRKGMTFYLPVLILLAIALASCSSGSGIDTEKPIPTPTPNPRADLQVPGLKELVPDYDVLPILPENPSLADRGFRHYYQICLACHGDWGQGLTDEWRATWGEDSNCWKSKCHAANHPSQGFDLPQTVPPVLGVGSIARFSNGEELHLHIAQTMPWWNPGSLSEDQAWEVTAYLLRERGEMEDDFPLEDGTAPAIRMHVDITPQMDNTPGSLALIGSLALVTVIFIVRKDSQS